MCTFIRQVAILTVLTLASSAKAATHVWFTGVPLSGGGSVQSGNAQGTELVLLCDPFPGSCSWDISIYFNNDPGDLGIVNWSLELNTNAVSGKLGATQGSLAYDHPRFTLHSGVPFYGTGPTILGNANGIDPSGIGQQGGKLAHFTLRKTKQSPAINTDRINAVVGSDEWANILGDYPIIQAGANPPIFDGGAVETDLGSVIRVLNSPEPATVMLLVVGAVALRRRG